MKFEVVRKYDNRPMMSTDNPNCIGFKYLDAQEASGYYFRVDGKRISGAEIKRRFNYQEPIEEIAVASPTVSTSSAPTTRKVKKIRCITNNKIYNNMSAAARDIGIDPAAVSYSMKVGRPTTSGYSFEFVEDDQRISE